MKSDTLAFFKRWFAGYVAAYHTEGVDSRNIKLKEKHTEQVCKEILMLGRALNLSAEDLLLAETMALFHDIGRFKQYATYGNFNDSLSENHAELGLRELAKHKVLSVCSEAEQLLITQAIRYHNVRVLPEIEDPRCLFFSRLLRDADKLDIYRVVIDYYKYRQKERNTTIELGLPDTQSCSPPILDAIRQRKIAYLKDMATLNDFKLLQISWVFDLNYTPTFCALHERRYVEQIAATLPQTGEISKLLATVEAYVRERAGIC